LLHLQPYEIALAQENVVIYQIVENITTKEEMFAAIVSGKFKFNIISEEKRMQEQKYTRRKSSRGD
jgi:hypothetical protein